MVEENIVKTEAATVAPQKKMELIRPPEGLASFYANHIQLGQSAW